MGRKKQIEDSELLEAAREVFVADGIRGSTRDIAKNAGISEAVIYQRFATKADLFFAAMVPPPLDFDALLKESSGKEGQPAEFESIALSLLTYFRKVTPILIPLISHPDFDFERFATRYPDSHMGRLRSGIVLYLEGQAEAGVISTAKIMPAGLTIVATMHSLAIFERLGVHGGKFTPEMVRSVARFIWGGLAKD